MSIRDDQIRRLQMMASGDAKWDLSPNDCAAIQAALDALLAKEAALDQARRERDEAEREVSALTNELTNLYTEATGYVGTILTAREIIAALMVKAKVGE